MTATRHGLLKAESGCAQQLSHCSPPAHPTPHPLCLCFNYTASHMVGNVHISPSSTHTHTHRFEGFALRESLDVSAAALRVLTNVKWKTGWTAERCRAFAMRRVTCTFNCAGEVQNKTKQKKQNTLYLRISGISCISPWRLHHISPMHILDLFMCQTVFPRRAVDCYVYIKN